METSQDLIATDGVGAQIGGMLGHGQQIGFNFQHVADEPDGIQGAHAEVVEASSIRLPRLWPASSPRPVKRCSNSWLPMLGWSPTGWRQLRRSPGDALLAFCAGVRWSRHHPVVVTMPVSRDPKNDREESTRPIPCPPPMATTRSKSLIFFCHMQ